MTWEGDLSVGQNKIKLGAARGKFGARAKMSQVCEEVPLLHCASPTARAGGLGHSKTIKEQPVVPNDY